MLASMTAFARHEDSGEWGHAVWEIRTVNHRYLDISIRLPEELRAMETGVRERISTKLKRGKVECGLRFDSDSTAGDICINAELTEKIINAGPRTSRGGLRDNQSFRRTTLARRN